MKKNYFLILFFVLATIGVEAQSIGGYNVYYGHLHNHSTISDGSGSPDRAYRYARDNAGLDFFSLGDHAEAISSSEYRNMKSIANSYNRDGSFVTFWGFEWSSSTYGHILITNADDYCTSRQSSTNTFDELSRWISQRECIAFFNHPGREDDRGREFDHFTDAPNDKFVGIELWNKTRGFDTYYYNNGYFSNDGGLNYWEEALARGWKLGAGGAEDNHGTNWGNRTDYRMAILANSLTRSALYSAMKQRRFFSTLDKNIALSFKVNGQEMGSTVAGGSYGMQIRATDGNNERFTRVILYKNGAEEQRWNVNTSSVNITYDINLSDGDNYYVKVTQSDGDEAISSPIWGEGGVSNTAPTCRITAPTSGTHYDYAQSITISASASDNDGSIASVEFFVDGESVGSDRSYPYSVSYSIPGDGAYSIVAKATDNLGATATSESVGISVGVTSQTVSSRIASGSDDVEEEPDGSMYSNSSDIELVYDGYVDGIQTVGLRFRDLNIPQGATITSAYVQFTCDERDSDNCRLTIEGHDADNSPAFSSRRYDVSSRSTTNAYVNWNPPAWRRVGDAGSAQRTPDISSIVQEIVSRSGYRQSSAITIIISGSGQRTAESYEGSSSRAAVLTVEYTVGSRAERKNAAIDDSQADVTSTQFSVYPNPTREGYVILRTNGAADQSLVQIFDTNGKPLLERTLQGVENRIPLSNLRPGVYYIRLKNSVGTEVKKVIVE